MSDRTDRIPQFRRWAYKGVVRHLFDQLMLVEYVRRSYMRLRYLTLSQGGRRIRIYGGRHEGVTEGTVAHNLRGLANDVGVVRSDGLVKPLSVLECLPPDARILCIGPRSEGELYNLAANGFRLEHLRGLDLISYSPRIDLGDMHALPYADDTWDAVLAGWVMLYSDDQPRAAREMVRVCHNGGVIAVAVEHNPKTREEIERELGYAPGSRQRFEGVDDLLALFAPHVERVYFSQEPTAQNRDRKGSIAAIFTVRK